MCFDVVPRTMESSTTATFLPRTTSLRGLSFCRTICSRRAWVGTMKLRPTWLFFARPRRYGTPSASAMPDAKK